MADTQLPAARAQDSRDQGHSLAPAAEDSGSSLRKPSLDREPKLCGRSQTRRSSEVACRSLQQKGTKVDIYRQQHDAMEVHPFDSFDVL